MPKLRAQLKEEGSFTRTQLVEKWGCSRHAVGRLERQGTLIAITGEGGIKRYPASEVENVERCGLRPRPRRRGRDPGWLAAQAFAMFREERDLRDVVVALKLTPDEVDRLYADYCTPMLEDRRIERESKQRTREFETMMKTHSIE